MPKQELRNAVDHVDEVLARSGDLEDERRERIREALAELHAALQDNGSHEEHHDTLFELAAHFAEDHPKLSAALGRVANAVAQLGI